jgi:hypothetical protein
MSAVNYDPAVGRLEPYGKYCVYDASIDACSTDIVRYDSSTGRMSPASYDIPTGNFCPAETYVIWDSTTGRLKPYSTSGKSCTAPASRVGGGCGSK